MSKKILILSLLCAFLPIASITSFAKNTNMQNYEISAKKCITFECAHAHIDQLNLQIVDLLAQRFAYVQRIGELKSKHNQTSNHNRETIVLTKVASYAKQIGFSPQIVIAVFKEILKQANSYESNFIK